MALLSHANVLLEVIMASDPRHDPQEYEPIPGERDPENLTSRESGSVGGQFTGADIPSADHLEWLDETTANERVREGGGRTKRWTGRKF